MNHTTLASSYHFNSWGGLQHTTWSSLSLRTLLINLKRHIFSFKHLCIVAGNIKNKLRTNIYCKNIRYNLFCIQTKNSVQSIILPKESYWTSFYSNCDNMFYIGDMEDTRFFRHFTCLSVSLKKNGKIMEDTRAQMENIWNSAKNIQNNVWTTNSVF